MTYVLAAAAASGAVIVAGWRSRRAGVPAGVRDGSGVPYDPLWGEPETDAGRPEALADVGAAIDRALQRMAPIMATRSVKVDVAAPFGLLARMRGAVLAELLEQLLTAAIHGAPGGRLLLTAATQGNCIHVGITDDVPGADPAVRAASVRGLMERVALCGGAVDIDVRPDAGTTIRLRLAAALEASQDRTSEHASEGPAKPAKGATPPLIPFMGGAIQQPGG